MSSLNTAPSTTPPILAMVLAAMLAGLMAASAFFSIPFPEVPMILANAFPWLAGLLLGPVWGAISVAIYLAIGAGGLPVFAGGTSGMGVLLGKTGGFLIGYLVAAIVVGLLRDRSGQNLIRTTAATVAGLLTIYLLGIPWLAFVIFKGAAGLAPEKLAQASLWATGSTTFPGLFLLGDTIKAIGVILVAQVLARLPGTTLLFPKKS